MAIALYITDEYGTADVTPLVQSVIWSGDYRQCARTLDFGLTSSPADANIPTAACGLGSGVLFEQDGEVLFNGFIFERQKETGSSVIDITCYDRGIYLRRNEAVYKFTNTAPESIVWRVCDDFGITAGSIAETGVKISRNFVGATLYGIIETAYTLASETTGEEYLVRFNGEKLDVIKKAALSGTPLIDGGANLISASTTESVTDLIDQVVIYDSSDKLIGTRNDSELIGKYGLFQSYCAQGKDDDAEKKVKKLLSDNGVSEKISVENLGDARCITGNTVIVREPYTGLYGLFYIDSDTHTWKNGTYFNKLVIDFKNIMDEQDVGELIG